MSWKLIKITKSGQKKVIPQWNIDKRIIDGKSLQLYRLVKKAAKKRMNQISNFEELECGKLLKINKSKSKS